MDNTDKTSQHSADSAIDMRDVETTAMAGDDADRARQVSRPGAVGGVINSACDELMAGDINVSCS